MGGGENSRDTDVFLEQNATRKTKPRSNSNTSYYRTIRNYTSNGVAVSRSSSRGSKQGSTQDSPYRVSNRTRQRDNSLSRAGGDSDSGRDSVSKSSISMMDSGDNYYHATSTRKGVYEDDDDNSHWIHRDKLARIESEELQQAALRLQRKVRARSKSSSRRNRSYDSHCNSINGSIITTPPTEYTEPWQTPRDEKRRSPTLESFEDEGPSEEERRHWDLRRPEEIAAEAEENGASKFYRNPGLRKGSSRIPVLTSSPVPISQEQIDREYPTPRTRNLGSGDEESTSYPKTRRPSESAVVDTPKVNGNSTPPSGGSRPASRGAPSPAKKTTAKSTPGSGARKTSATTAKKTTQHKSRATSGSNSSNHRSKAGENRPINRPEGDPPWLATMYKPDPRLPPEQQILPTHARRMQQEQWEKEGKTPVTYDREFAPLSVRPDDEPPRPINNNNNTNSDDDNNNNDNNTNTNTNHNNNDDPEPEEKPQEPESSSSWPLQATKSPEQVNHRPGTNGTAYSTIPKVQNTPPIGVAPSPRLTQQPTVTTQVTSEKKKAQKEKSLLCCVVM